MQINGQGVEGEMGSIVVHLNYEGMGDCSRVTHVYEWQGGDILHVSHRLMQAQDGHFIRLPAELHEQPATIGHYFKAHIIGADNVGIFFKRDRSLEG